MTEAVVKDTAGVSRLDSTRRLNAERKRVLIASVIGSVFEWYDFVVYGIASALVFNKLFFPVVDPVVGTIASFGTYAVGYVARPLGGAIFGHFGDRLGRKAMLSLTLLIMGVGTFLIGCLPTYAQIGLWAPALLIALRFMQGLGIGGEWAGSILMAVEHAPPNRRGLFGSLVQLGYPIGVLVSTSVFSVMAWLPQEDFLSWGWRLPFLVSILFAAAGVLIRMRVAESPVFERAAQPEKLAKVPLIEILTRYRRTFLLAVGLKISEIAWVSVATIVTISYVTIHLGLPKSVILNGLLWAAALELLTIPLFGHLSDRFGRRTMFLIGCTFSILFAFPLFHLLDTRDPVIIAMTIAVAVSLGQGIMFGPEAAWMSELFHTRLRYSGASLGFQLGGAISGGLTPLAAALLMNWAGGATWPVSCLLIGTACITLFAAWLAPETAHAPLRT
ncbi:MHS family shikimate/dehydroshikimate transporter-like MFS transporter [Paraburkholderia unamae]|uniref:MFS transporter n=1 Tax=Paraburkholderia unamae TaxID=219649 RepID=UPI000DC2D36F|nr:MFS transporter [Paraburkholderia unamae]RAR54258.1 MHS family shikimate/dehydroshikimate transporter-like MFS transporter [Paraburkholderia unamae]